MTAAEGTVWQRIAELERQVDALKTQLAVLARIVGELSADVKGAA